MTNIITRRRFLGQLGATSLALGMPSWLRAQTNAPAATGYRNLISPDKKLRIAAVGCGGKGRSDIINSSSEEIVALCDVDFARASETFAYFPNAPRYRDFRQMLMEMGDGIDAVTVSTPDHMHYPVARLAMEMGKHVYVQKPMAHSVGEARALKKLAIETGVVTQMGNQGHANEGTRLFKEWIDAGVIGKVTEAHIWTDRPVWPQPAIWVKPVPPPPTIDWDLWIGVATYHDYRDNIAPFNWRAYWDFGSGALGDMGCHTMDACFWALNLRGPVKVSAEMRDATLISAPGASKVTYEFAATPERGAIKLCWYDGGFKPPIPKELGNGILPKTGTYVIGDKGVIMTTGDYNATVRLLPESRMQEFLPHRPPKVIPRVPGSNPHLEWINACKGGPKPGSNFIDHSADLSEMVQLGNVALRMGRPIDWDPATGTCIGLPEDDAIINKNYRLY
jgi:predicted dehydrogenase